MQSAPNQHLPENIPMNHYFSFLLTPLLVLVLGTCVRAQTAEPVEKPISSAITAATVYLDGAQVSRTARTTVPAGRATLVFTGLTKDMDPASIQLRAADESFVVLSVSHRLNFNEPPADNPEADKIYAAMDDLDARKERLTVDYRITEQEEQILKLNRVVASPQTGLDADDLVAAVNFHRERITFIKRRQYAISDSISKIEEAREDLQKQLSELGRGRQGKATAEVVVVTQSDRAVTDEFTVTYLVPNARWTPHYDVRVTDISRPVDLRYRAKVSQQTGEDWTDVRLTLSTGDPTANGNAPELSPWRLTRNSRPPTYRPQTRRQIETGVRTVMGTVIDETGEALIGATILVPGTAIGAVTDINGQYSFEVPVGTRELVISYVGYNSKTISANSGRTVLETDAAQLDEVVVTGYAARGSRAERKRRDKAAGSPPPPPPPPAAPPVTVQRRATTVSFDIDLPYTIPADGKARDVEIRQHDLPATYTHLAVPKFSPDAYLTAAVTDWEQYDLLSGQVQLFFEGTFLGTSALDVSSTSDTLQLSLGRDPSVIVERKAIDNYRERSFFGSKITDSRGYTVSVRNKKAQPINVVIMDQVPVSGDETIEVKTDIDKVWSEDEVNGLLTWRTRVAAGDTQKAKFGYTVKYPKGAGVRLE